MLPQDLQLATTFEILVGIPAAVSTDTPPHDLERKLLHCDTAMKTMTTRGLETSLEQYKQNNDRNFDNKWSFLQATKFSWTDRLLPHLYVKTAKASRGLQTKTWCDVQPDRTKCCKPRRMPSFSVKTEFRSRDRLAVWIWWPNAMRKLQGWQRIYDPNQWGRPQYAH